VPDEMHDDDVVIERRDRPVSVEEFELRQSAVLDQLQELDRMSAGQTMTEEQRSTWNKLNEEFEDNKNVISELKARQERLNEVLGSGGGTSGRSVESGTSYRSGRAASTDIYDVWTIRNHARSADQESRMLHDNAMRAVERADYPHPQIDDDVAREHIEGLMKRFQRIDESDHHGLGRDNVGSFSRMILMTGSPLYQRAFGKHMMGYGLSPEEQRALSTATTAGGFAVPFSLDPTVIPTSNSSVNPYRAIARVETITTSFWKGVSSAGVSASYKAEGAEATDDSPTLAQPSIEPERADVFVPYSIEIGQDWGSLQTEIAQMVADAKDDLEATKFTSGAGHGSTEPQGLITGATTLVTGATSATFALADVYSLYSALPPRFKPRAQWLGNEVVYNNIRQFDTAGGASLWIDNLQLPTGGQGNPGNLNARLLGRPANEVSAMAATPSTTGAKVLVIGDFRYYVIVDRVGMSVETVPHLFGTNSRPTGQRGAFFFWRNSAGVISANAFRTLIVR
jgi:HK97 family phage major capsid protein